MEPTTIFHKTAKGQEEVERRTLHLHPKLRRVLIMINGKQSVAELTNMGFDGAELSNLLQQLVDAELIEAAAPPPPVVPQVTGQSGVWGLMGKAVASQPGAGTPEQKAFEKLRADFSRLVHDALGPGGDAWALKIEKTKAVDELRPMVNIISEVVKFTANPQEADALRARLEALLDAQAGAAAAPAAPAASGAGLDPKVFIKLRGEFSRMVFDTLGPDGEMIAAKVEKIQAADELVAMVDKAADVVAVMLNRKTADALRERLNNLLDTFGARA